MKTVKVIVRFACFICILGFVSLGIYRVLAWKDTKGILELYNCPANSIDVLFLGSSHSFCTINTAILWEDYGIAANDIAENGQIIATEYHYLKEALKTQRPKVVFAEIWGIDMVYSASGGNIYRNIVNMKWSDNYFQNLNAAILGSKDVELESEKMYEIKKGMILKFPVIHTRYNELTEGDFSQKDNKLLRYSPNWTTKSNNTPAALSITDKAELTEEQKTALWQLIDLSEKYNFRLVLWVAPYVVTKQHIMVYNAVEQFAEDNGIDCYNISQNVDGAGFDFSKDLRVEKYVGGHMNCFGAEKVTRYIGELLKNNYNLQDHRNDPAYSWFDRMAREWDVECAAHDLDSAKSLQDYASALDYSLFNTTVIDYREDADVLFSSGSSDARKKESNDGDDGENLIKNTESFSDWFTAKQQYISYPDPGTVLFSASGLNELSYSRIEGPISMKTTDFINDGNYVLSFEVMSPDWSAVAEPTTDHSGLDAVAITFVTANDSPMGNQMAYRFIRLGKTRAELWEEVPTAKDGEWLKYTSVPLKFTSTNDTWSDYGKGIGEYLRVGPSLRANGTVYFRNFRLEKNNQYNDSIATLRGMTQEIENRSKVIGLYTNGIQNKINSVWELSDQAKLLVDEDDIHQTRLYNGSNEVQINECDVCVIVVDKENGKLIKKNEFVLSGDVFRKM